MFDGDHDLVFSEFSVFFEQLQPGLLLFLVFHVQFHQNLGFDVEFVAKSGGRVLVLPADLGERLIRG